LIVVGVTVALVTAVAVMGRFDRARLVVGVMLFASSIAIIKDWRGRPQATWFMPVQVNRSTIVLGAGLLLYLAAIGNLGRVSISRLAGPALLTLAAALYGGLIEAMHSGASSGIESLAFAMSTIAPLALVAPGLCSTAEDRLRMLRVILGANLVWLIALAIQLLVNSSVVTQGKSLRLYGLTGNPQHTGVMMAIFAVVTLWVLIHTPRGRSFSLLLTLLTIDLLMVLWTGSRTAGAMFVLGAMLVLRHRAGRAILLFPIAALALYVALSLAGQDVSMKAERLFSTANTREESWRGLIESASRNPLFGVGRQETQSSENSYLFAFSAYGVFMAAILVLVGVTAAVQSFRLWRLSRWLPAVDRALVDLVHAFYAMYFAGSILEGYMMAQVAVPLVMIVLMSSLGVELSREAREARCFNPREDRDGAWDGADEVDALDPWMDPPPAGGSALPASA